MRPATKKSSVEARVAGQGGLIHGLEVCQRDAGQVVAAAEGAAVARMDGAGEHVAVCLPGGAAEAEVDPGSADQGVVQELRVLSLV